MTDCNECGNTGWRKDSSDCNVPCWCEHGNAAKAKWEADAISCGALYEGEKVIWPEDTDAVEADDSD